MHSPPRTPPKKNLKGISWLSRSHSNTSAGSSSKQIRISEPRFANVLDMYAPPRTGVLGAGAVVVKTPMEALSAQFFPEEDETCVEELPSPPASPELPPVPFQTEHTPQPAPEPLSQKPAAASLLHAHPRLPHFSALLLGPAPAAGADPAQVLVALETGTTTHRTTLATLTSRPSHLAAYLATLVPAEAPDAQSPGFASIFHTHLAESGLLSQASASVRVFLDRPSEP